MEQCPIDAVSNPFPPLYFGQSFFCYRDINKAIERHRDMFGLRLALKRAIKLENYCLTVDQMKDLNLRLKYGALDYHCFAATGRPGRPGNDERCPQLVRLKLSPDAQSLIVYETHNHNIMPIMELPPANLQNAITADASQAVKEDTGTSSVPICSSNDNSPGSSNLAIVTSASNDNNPNVISLQTSNSFVIKCNNSFTSLVPVMSPSSNAKIMAEPISLLPKTPINIASAQNLSPKLSKNTLNSHEKITVKLKKSECVPNEMVVVGSLRHVQEQHQKHIASSTELLVPKTEVGPVTSSMSASTPPSTKQTFNVQKSISKPIILTTKSVMGPKNIAPKLNRSSIESPITNLTVQNKKSPGIGLSVKPLATLKQSSSVGINAKVSAANKSSDVAAKQNISVKTSPSNQSSFKLQPKGLIAKAIGTSKPAVPGRPNTSGTSPKLGVAFKPNPQGKPTVLKQSANMKQVIINKPKAAVGASKTSVNKPNVSPTVKPLVNGNTKLNVSGSKPLPIKCSPVQKTSIGVPKVNNSPSGSLSSDNEVTPQNATNKLGEKVKEKSNNGGKNIVKIKNGINSRQGSPVSTNGTSPNVAAHQVNGTKIVSIPKKLKKKPGRLPDLNTSIGTTINTDLGFNEKQNLAHGVLMQLLRVTSQLPMADFSHALETLETLTDAFRLNQRVSLAISHDEEEDDFIIPYIKEEADFDVSSTTDDYLLSQSQLDGQLDSNNLLKELAIFQDIGLNPGHEMRLPPREEAMDIEPPKVQEVIVSPPRIHVLPPVFVPNHSSSCDVINSHRGIKRSVSSCFGNSDNKKIKN